jgi:hypothetical protein
MILELGSAAEFIRVSAEYSNAVMVAVLPYISDFAAKLDLPVPHPIGVEHVASCAVLPWRDGGASITIKGDWSFPFQFGCVRGFQGPHAYYGLQDPNDIPKFFGQVKMSKEDAIQLARNTITKLGIPLESVFAEQEPRVTMPIQIETNTVPHYRVEWLDPRAGVVAAAELDIDANAKRVVSMSLSSRNLRRPSPKISVVPLIDTSYKRWPSVNPEYAWRLIPIVLRAIDEYGRKLALPMPQPVTTNHVTRFSVSDNGGWPHCEIELTNGWRFVYRNSMVNGYYAPDNLFNSDNRPILIKEFVGKWNMTETEAIDLVLRNLLKLNYPTNLVHTDFKPEVRKPTLPSIPRYSISWYYVVQDDLRSKVEAEVDADKGELKSLYYDDVSYWNHPPEINVPISLTVPAETNAAPSTRSEKPGSTSRPPPRPFRPFPTQRGASAQKHKPLSTQRLQTVTIKSLQPQRARNSLAVC